MVVGRLPRTRTMESLRVYCQEWLRTGPPLPRKELRRISNVYMSHVAATPYGGEGWGEGAEAELESLARHGPRANTGLNRGLIESF